MDARKLVLKETAVIAVGQGICIAAMIGVFALLGYFELPVLWGGLIGAVLAIGNFFFMAITTSLAADKAAEQDVDGGKKLLKGTYPIRMVALTVLMIVFIKSGFCNIIALLLPLLFVRPIIMIAEFFRKKGE